MKIALAKNIRALRRERGLTQERLAEMLGVTVGAVHKWETGLSQPELTTLIELAGVFSVSVDALLGYEQQDDSLQATAERLRVLRQQRDPSAADEAERALRRYPNAFAVVYQSAAVYQKFGIEKRDEAMLRRALTLLDRARQLLPQNTDRSIGEVTLTGEKAAVLVSLGRGQEAVELLQNGDTGALYLDLIGQTLAADLSRPDEAEPYLSKALLHGVEVLIRTVIGLANVYEARRDYAAMQALLGWAIGVFSGLTEDGRPCFLDKICAMLQILLAAARCAAGNGAAARDALCAAKVAALCFDAAPSYRTEDLRFVIRTDRATLYDDLGETAMAGVRRTVADIGDAALSDLWDEVDSDDEG